MKKILMGTIFLAMALVGPIPTMAGAEVDVRVSLPPLITFAAPPEMVVIPETNVYTVPDSEVDIYFNNGWWWRNWEGRWYRSRNYKSGWSHYRSVPAFYAGIPSGWRNDYRQHQWKGHAWNYQRIPHKKVQGNWRNWERTRHWEKQNTWGVQDLRSRPQSRADQPSRAGQPQSGPNQSGEDRGQREHNTGGERK